MTEHKFLNKVNQGDCIDVLKQLPDESVQTVFADPPFNLNKKYRSYKDNMEMERYFDWTRKWMVEITRVLKPDGSVFVYNIPSLLIQSANILNNLLDFRHWIVWNNKSKPLGKTLFPAHYGILFYTKQKDSKFSDIRIPHLRCATCKGYANSYGGKESQRHHFGPLASDVWSDIWRIKNSVNRISNHPCQLPVHLLERIILMSTDEGDVFLDPFCGGGTGAIAAKQLGRSYIGIDIDDDYCKTSQSRYNAAALTMINQAYVSLHRKQVVSIRDVDVDALIVNTQIPMGI